MCLTLLYKSFVHLMNSLGHKTPVLGHKWDVQWLWDALTWEVLRVLKYVNIYFLKNKGKHIQGNVYNNMDFNHLHFNIFPRKSFLVAQTVKNLPAMQETWVWSLGQKDPLEKGMATHSNILAWRIPCTGETGKQQSMWLQRVRHDWVTITSHVPLNRRKKSESPSTEVGNT